jgi:hypothetical protein
VEAEDWFRAQDGASVAGQGGGPDRVAGFRALGARLRVADGIREQARTVGAEPLFCGPQASSGVSWRDAPDGLLLELWQARPNKLVGKCCGLAGSMVNRKWVV